MLTTDENPKGPTQRLVYIQALENKEEVQISNVN